MGKTVESYLTVIGLIANCYITTSLILKLFTASATPATAFLAVLFLGFTTCFLIRTALLVIDSLEEKQSG